MSDPAAPAPEDDEKANYGMQAHSRIDRIEGIGHHKGKRLTVGCVLWFFFCALDGYLLAASKRGNVSSMKEVLDQHRSECNIDVQVREGEIC
jgi:hypothetical protein